MEKKTLHTYICEKVFSLVALVPYLTSLLDELIAVAIDSSVDIL